MTDFPSQQPWDLRGLRGARHSSPARAPGSPTPSSPSPPLPDGLSSLSFHQGGPSSRRQSEFCLPLRLPYPKDHLCVRGPFKYLSIEKLKVERKEAISEQMSDHPSRTLPASGYRVLRAPTPVRCPRRVNPGRLHTSFRTPPRRPAPRMSRPWSRGGQRERRYRYKY